MHSFFSEYPDSHGKRLFVDLSEVNELSIPFQRRLPTCAMISSSIPRILLDRKRNIFMGVRRVDPHSSVSMQCSAMHCIGGEKFIPIGTRSSMLEDVRLIRAASTTRRAPPRFQELG